MKIPATLASIAIGLLLTGCAASASSPSSPPSSESAESRNATIASCGVVARMISGDIPINASTSADAEKTLRQMADNGPGEVKNTASCGNNSGG